MSARTSGAFSVAYGLLFPIFLARFCCTNHAVCKNKKNILENLSCLTRDAVSGGKILPQRCGPLPAKIPVFSSSSQLKRLRHLIRCRPHLFWVWSDIKVQRGTGVGVAQNLLYALYVCPTAQQQRGTAVTQIVGRQIWEPMSLHEAFDTSGHCIGIPGRKGACLSVEQKALLQNRIGKAFLLLCSELTEKRAHTVQQGDHSHTGRCLGGTDHRALRCGMGDMAFHVEKRVSGVHVPATEGRGILPGEGRW